MSDMKPNMIARRVIRLNDDGTVTQKQTLIRQKGQEIWLPADQYQSIVMTEDTVYVDGQPYVAQESPKKPKSTQ